MISGCSGSVPRSEFFDNKLKKMIGINSQIGSCVGYNSRLFNGPAFTNERLFQQLNGLANSRITFQQFNKIKSQYGL